MRLRFRIGDKAVYPAHGVGIIKNIESKEIAGSKQDFYVLQIISSGAILMVPINGSEKAGMRSLMTNKEIEQVYSILRGPGQVSKTTWNRRFREFGEKIRTGSICDIAEVLRDLNSLQETKDLSFGEKKMMDKAMDMLTSEICAALSKDRKEVEAELNSIMLPN